MLVGSCSSELSGHRLQGKLKKSQLRARDFLVLTLTVKLNCHPDRSDLSRRAVEAKWRDLLCSQLRNPIPNGNPALSFVIPTEAKRSRGICSSFHQPPMLQLEE